MADRDDRDVPLPGLLAEIQAFVRRVDVEEAILFGARARNEHLLNDDVDLILISPEFAGVRCIDRYYPPFAEWRLPFYLQALPYTPEEFEAKRKFSGLVATAARDGLRIRRDGPLPASEARPSPLPCDEDSEGYKRIGLTQLVEEVKDFMRRAGVSEAILFGSRVRNEHLVTSDVDLLVVSDRFRDVPWLQRIHSLYAFWTLPLYLEVLPYTPEEFARKSETSPVVRAAIKEGVRIRVRGPATTQTGHCGAN